MNRGISNFSFLELPEPQAYRLAILAERYFVDDPNTSLIKLRQLSELIAQLSASRFGMVVSPADNLSDVLRRLKFECNLPRDVNDLFHALRIAGNRAAHGSADDHSSALSSLKLARQLATWYVRTFHHPNVKLGPFLPPAAPPDVSVTLASELERLKAELEASQSEAERLKSEAVEAEVSRRSAAEDAEAARQDRAIWEALAEEAEKDRSVLSARLNAVLKSAQRDDAPAVETVMELAQEAADQIDLDEADTRALIDQQLRDAGWEADTPSLRYARGSRPVKGRCLAIAEWPTASGPVDYALFCGRTLVGVIEAKRRNRNVMAVLRQAERYAADIQLSEAEHHDGAPWAEFQAPFAFSTNGRPYLSRTDPRMDRSRSGRGQVPDHHDDPQPANYCRA